MHELSIAHSIIDIVRSSVPEGFSGKITEIHMDIGVLSGIENDPLLFSYNIIKENTLAASAALIIKTQLGKALCQPCNQSFQILSYGQSCPDCGQFVYEITEGKEFKIASIVYEDN